MNFLTWMLGKVIILENVQETISNSVKNWGQWFEFNKIRTKNDQISYAIKNVPQITHIIKNGQKSYMFHIINYLINANQKKEIISHITDNATHKMKNSNECWWVYREENRVLSVGNIDRSSLLGRQ